MSIFERVFGKREKQIEPDQIDILIHEQAAYFGEHGRMIATNRELNIIEKPVIFCLKGFSKPLPLNHRMYAHIWKSFLAEGWIPIELIKYGTVIENHESGQQGGQRQAPHLVHGQTGPAAIENAARMIPNQAVAQASGQPGDFSRLEVPAFLRRQQEEGEGFTTSEFGRASLSQATVLAG
jgi:hypothetical protein